MTVDAAPPAVIQPTPVETDEAQFRRELREHMVHVKRELRDLKDAVDFLLKAQEIDDG